MPDYPADDRPAGRLSLQVLAVASEVFPLVKTGGLADVVGALRGALAAHDIRVRTLVPGYPAVLEKVGAGEPAHFFSDLFGGPARLVAGAAAGVVGGMILGEVMEDVFEDDGGEE